MVLYLLAMPGFEKPTQNIKGKQFSEQNRVNKEKSFINQKGRVIISINEASV